MRLRRLLLALVASIALVAAGCGDDDDSVDTVGEGEDEGEEVEVPTIRIGAQDFGESAILAEIYGQVLEANGYTVEQVSLGGFRDVLLGAFESGEVNFSPEYAASMVQFIAEEGATSDAAETVENLNATLGDRDLQALEPAPAIDTNAFVVTQETSDEHDLTKISDIPDDGGGLRLAAPQDCETNPFCLVGLQDVYGIDLSSGFTPLDAGLVADTLEAGEAEIGVLFSTSGRIADEGWVLLEDDKNMLAADNVTPVLSDELVAGGGDDLITLINAVSAEIDTEILTELNKRFEIDKEDADDIAADFIDEAAL